MRYFRAHMSDTAGIVPEPTAIALEADAISCHAYRESRQSCSKTTSLHELVSPRLW